MYTSCYKCGVTLDDFPSNFCVDCRASLLLSQDPNAPIRMLAQRLDEQDIRWLIDVGIRIDADMVKIQ